MTIEFVICGLEHSGTTLISDLFRQVDGLDAGFEAGVLLSEKPSEFQTLEPFATIIKEGWNIDEAAFTRCCAAPTHTAFYKQLKIESADLLGDNTKIFDKTPRYLSRLDDCLTRTDAPFIASFKDPRAIVHSDFRRVDSDDFFGWYKDYMPKKRHYLRTCYRQYKNAKANEPRVFFISLEMLALDARNSMDAMFGHVGLEFSLNYMLMNGLRYANTRSNAVSIPIAFSYLADFDDQHTNLIEKDFAELEDWFYW
ncbi:MAG: sulfotransferase [Pseudomonadota bacterium]